MLIRSCMRKCVIVKGRILEYIALGDLTNLLHKSYVRIITSPSCSVPTRQRSRRVSATASRRPGHPTTHRHLPRRVSPGRASASATRLTGTHARALAPATWCAITRSCIGICHPTHRDTRCAFTSTTCDGCVIAATRSGHLVRHSPRTPSSPSCSFPVQTLRRHQHEEHTQHLETVLARLHKFNLRLNVPKCVFAKPEVTFLSHTINSKGFTPLKEKVQSIVDFPQPRNIDELRRFLGLINFYRPFIRHAAVLAAPLTALITGAKKKDLTPILWSPEAAQAFSECKLALANVTHLSFPQENAKIRLVTDASSIAAGAVLEQLSDLGWQPLETTSTSSSKQLKERMQVKILTIITSLFLALVLPPMRSEHLEKNTRNHHHQGLIRPRGLCPAQARSCSLRRCLGQSVRRSLYSVFARLASYRATRESPRHFTTPLFPLCTPRLLHSFVEDTAPQLPAAHTASIATQLPLTHSLHKNPPRTTIHRSHTASTQITTRRRPRPKLCLSQRLFTLQHVLPLSRSDCESSCVCTVLSRRSTTHRVRSARFAQIDLLSSTHGPNDTHSHYRGS
ncbi:unnamed protein product [Trichogramma brassicae]|uniref:RNA-directed DNA polymerase n=1 Tax=Trichogramma brassicae TaxID=86971 RepID=A0A6H5J5R9_9HYME|nr:unnamed protein product [Trichogramma brassicae]